MAAAKQALHSKSDKAYAMARSNYARSLMVGWVYQHRPDVAQVSKEEALKKFPRRNLKIMKIVLPVKLADMK